MSTDPHWAGAGLPGTDVVRLKRQAKQLLRHGRAGDEQALELLARFHPRGPELVEDPGALTLADAQLTLARWYGFASWPRLRAHLRLTDPWKRAPHRVTERSDPADELLRLGCLTYGADALNRPVQAAALLASHPELGTSSIHTAAATGAVQAIRRFTADNLDLANAEGGPHGWPPLLYLCYSRIPDAPPNRSTLAAAEALLTAGADPNAGFLWEGLAPPFTAITGAFGGGEDAPNQPPHESATELARMLLEAGADANDGQTLYNRMFTADDDHLELLFAYGLGRGDGGPWRRRLGEAQQSPTVMCVDQLIWAVAMGRKARVGVLLRHGVDPNRPGSGHPSHRGLSAYETALRSGSSDLVDMLAAAGAEPPADQLDPVDALLADLLAGDREAARRADPALLGRARARHDDAVAIAVELRRAEAVQLLVAAGFNVSGADTPDNATPLHQAAYRGDLAMVRLLVELGADVTRSDPEHHSTPRGWAEHGHHEEVARYLASCENRPQA